MNENENLFVPASMCYDQEMVPKSKDWVERLNLDRKLPNFNTGRVLVSESQAVNESLKPIDASITPESSNDSEAESYIPLPPLKSLQGASPSSECFINVTVSETKPTTPSVPTEVKNTEQESKINELTKLAQMLIDKKVNYTQKTQESNSQIQQTKSSKILYCMICKREDLRTSDHEMYTASLKRSENYKAKPYHVIHVEALYTPPLTTMNLITSKERHIREPIWYMDSGCSRSMTGVKSYLHKYVEQPGPKKCLHLLHMDLFGPVSPMSNHEKYTLVIVDEYSRYTWVHFLRKKSQAPEMIMSFIRMVENQNDVKVKQIRTDNGTKFRNHELESFCNEKGISQNFSSPYTSEQNGVAKRKNKTLIEAARTMLNGSVLSKHLWTEAVIIACYTQNISIIVKRHDKTPYEIFRERILDIRYFHVFGCPVFIHHGFVGYPFDYRIPLGFGSIAGGLDLVNPIIRLPIEHGMSSGTRVDISALTIEQYLALIQDNSRQGIVKPKIGDDVDFEINSYFMRELRRKLFIGAGLKVEKRLPAGMINTWDLLEKEFIWQHCSPFKTAKKLEEICIFKQEINETLYHAWEIYSDLLYRCPQHDLNWQQKIIHIIGMMKQPLRKQSLTALITLMPFKKVSKRHILPRNVLSKEDKTVEQSKYIRSLEETIIKFYDESIKKQAMDDEWIRKSIKNTESNIRALKNTTKNLQEKAYQLTQTDLTNTGEKRTTIGKGNLKEPAPCELPPTPFLGHLKEQMGSPYRTRETVCMIENPKEVHIIKAQEDEGDMGVGWDITIRDVERLWQFLTPAIHTLPNLEPVVQLEPVHDKEKIVREEE
ncbi:retrovirus-related pol polyprotein from transposon TNT 1-94 [Tanacetum coccineum]